MFSNLLLAIVAAYLLGSIPSGVIMAHLFARRDVRETGSGHTGALNTFRTAGIFAAMLVFLADAGKAVLALYLARILTANEWGIAFAGIAVVLGHCYPLYTRFHGGMGLATGAAALVLLNAPLLLALMLLWLPLKLVLKKSPRASAIVALALPILLLLTRAEASSLVFGLGVGTIVFWRHLADWNRQF